MDRPSIYHQYSPGLDREVACGNACGDALAGATSERDQILFFEPLDLYRSSPESGDLQRKSGVSKQTIWSHSEGWWQEDLLLCYYSQA